MTEETLTRIEQIVETTGRCGRMNDPTGGAFVRGQCGDELEMYLLIRDEVVEEATYYTTNGCSLTKACGAIVTDNVSGRTVEDTLQISPQSVIERIGSLERSDQHCAILAVITLHKALADYLLKP